MRSKKKIKIFRATIYRYYRMHGRDFPWRRTKDPYRILVSEIMLQQTQTYRVTDKYVAFIKAFPDFHTLSRAPLKKVLQAWQGLGYNRRALFLRKLAVSVMRDHGGTLPTTVEALEQLPGIGPATARSIAAFAFNQPVVFIETNIRTVFIHFFFPQRRTVTDAEILPLVASTLDRRDPYRWYSALMDYGVMLKREHGNASRRSAHYVRQSPFQGSDRQLRGRILKTVLAHQALSLVALVRALAVSDVARLEKVIVGLVGEHLLQVRAGRYYIA